MTSLFQETVSQGGRNHKMLCRKRVQNTSFIVGMGSHWICSGKNGSVSGLSPTFRFMQFGEPTVDWVFGWVKFCMRTGTGCWHCGYHGFEPDLHACAWLYEQVIKLGLHRQESLPLTTYSRLLYSPTYKKRNKTEQYIDKSLTSLKNMFVYNIIMWHKNSGVYWVG